MSFYRGDPNRHYPVGKSKLPPDYRPEAEAKFGSTVGGGAHYNPEITYYYNAADVVIKIEEVYDGKKFTQTISGTGNYSNQVVSYYATYSAWEETTVS